MVIIKMVTVRMSDFPKVHVCLIAFISDVLSRLLLQDGCVFTFQGIAGFFQRLLLKAKGDSYAEI